MCVCIYTYMKTIESSCYKEKIYSHGKGVCKVALIRRFNSKLFHDIHLVFIYHCWLEISARYWLALQGHCSKFLFIMVPTEGSLATILKNMILSSPRTPLLRLNIGKMWCRQNKSASGVAKHIMRRSCPSTWRGFVDQIVLKLPTRGRS